MFLRMTASTASPGMKSPAAIAAPCTAVVVGSMIALFGEMSRCSGLPQHRRKPALDMPSPCHVQRLDRHEPLAPPVPQPEKGVYAIGRQPPARAGLQAHLHGERCADAARPG